MRERKYGLFTSITMITGIVIGAGIFFKSDDLLFYTNGNVLLSVLIFIVAAIAIIFGCLSVSSLSVRCDAHGGVIAYMNEFVGRPAAGALGWFQAFLYYPALIAVVCWISGMYMCSLFGIDQTVSNSTIIGALVMCLFFAFNVLSAKLGGTFQNVSMIIKLIPLIIIAVAGLAFGNPSEQLIRDMHTLPSGIATTGFIAGFAPIAFSYDGWVVSTSICHEIKNSKRNLPLALILSPIIILVCYILFFVGICSLLGPETIMAQGNDSIYTAANMIFGANGAKLILVFVIVSVLGTVNGLVLGSLRIPYSLALNNMLPHSKKILSHGENRSYGAALIAFAASLFWLAVNHFTQRAVMPGDVSEIGICFGYINYAVLYVAVMKLAKKGLIKSKFKGYVVPSLAILGSAIIVCSIIGNPLALPYFIVYAAVVLAGYVYCSRQAAKTN